jgi:general nucleoside transport system permease protein
VLTGPLGLSQPLTGIGLTLLAAGLAAFTFTALFGAAPPTIAPVAPVRLPGISDLPFFGEALLQTPLTYLALVLVLVISYLFTRTPLGLAIRACGENPAAVAAQGRSVQGLRIGAVMAGSALMGLGGASLSLTAGSFSAGMINGRGFICVALATLTGWRTSLVLIVALVIGGIDAYQLRAQKEFALASQLFLMAPFVALIIALALTRTSRRPRALLAASVKESGSELK